MKAPNKIYVVLHDENPDGYVGEAWDHEEAPTEHVEYVRAEFCADGRVFTDCDPHNIFVDSEKWNDLLGRFQNGQKVKLIIIPNDEG